MALGKVTAIHVLTDWTCNAGTVKAVVPVVRWELTGRIENYVVWNTLTCTVPSSWESSAELVVGRVLKVWFNDNGTADFEEYRITEMVDDVVGGVATLTATGWLTDLVEKNTLATQTATLSQSFVFTDSGATPTSHLTTRVDALLPTYWSIGTVTPSSAINVSYSNATPLAAAIAIATAAAVNDGVTYEISARRNGITGLVLDLTVYGIGTLDLRAGKNLSSMRRTTKRAEQTTRASFSASNALRRPTYRVSAVVAATYVELVQVNGSGAGPVQETNQFLNAYLVEWKNNTTHLITATTRQSYGTSRLNMAVTATILVDDIVFLASDASMTDFSFVDSPSLQTTHGIRLGVPAGVSGETNVFRNGDCAVYTAGGFPTFWYSGTATPITTPGLFLTGGRSMRLPNDSGFSLTVLRDGSAGAGLRFVHTSGYQVTYSCTVRVDNTTNNFQVNFRDPLTAAWTGTILLTNQPADTWVTLSATFRTSAAIPAGLVGQLGIQFMTNVTVDATRLLYIDSVQCLVNSTETAFRLDSGSASNVATANRLFVTNGTPTVSYEASLVDLSLTSPGEYTGDRPSLGATCYLTESTTGTTRTALRIVGLTSRSESQATPQVVLSTLPKRLTTLLA